MKTKTTKYLTVRTIPISNGKILGNIDTPNTLIHDLSFLCIPIRVFFSPKANC